MVYSAAQLVRTQGVTATGVRDVVTHADAPRGSFQHYFPGGKDQLIGEALLWSAGFAAQWVETYRYTGRSLSPAGLFAHMARQWKAEFTSRGFQHGCPVMAAAADLAGSDSTVREPLLAAADQWEQAVVSALVRMDVPRRRARRLAVVMLGALEGAIMLARIRRDVAPLDTVVGELSPLLDASVAGASGRARAS
jgi:AcrR family transcriptional regulator